MYLPRLGLLTADTPGATEAEREWRPQDRSITGRTFPVAPNLANGMQLQVRSRENRAARQVFSRSWVALTG